MCDSREFCRSSRDSTIGINFDALGDVEHFEHISGDFFDLFKSGEHADVTFLISGVKFPAHRVILAARCTYFKVLLFGEMMRLIQGQKFPFKTQHQKHLEHCLNTSTLEEYVWGTCQKRWSGGRRGGN